MNLVPMLLFTGFYNVDKIIEYYNSYSNLNDDLLPNMILPNFCSELSF